MDRPHRRPQCMVSVGRPEPHHSAPRHQYGRVVHFRSEGEAPLGRKRLHLAQDPVVPCMMAPCIAVPASTGITPPMPPSQLPATPPSPPTFSAPMLQLRPLLTLWLCACCLCAFTP